MHETYKHPLAAALAQLDLTAAAYLKKLSARHAALGFGPIGTRREKVTRWLTGIAVPEPTVQAAMADLHGVPAEVVAAAGWPDWLLAAFPDDRLILDASWTAAGTLASLAASARGGAMDRREFLITGGGVTLGALAAQWAGALTQPAAASSGRRRLTLGTVQLIDQRLGELRRLDDVLGGGELRRTAVSELDLIDRLTRNTTYTGDVSRALFTTVSEANRMCGWQHFDFGRHAAAQSYYITALRASATANNPEAGAHVLSFMTIQTYSVGNPRDAVTLMETALDQARHHTTPRVLAMLHARHARALSKTPGGKAACARALNRARAAFDAGSHDDDPPWVYWMTQGELEMIAASCALDVGDPSQALAFFHDADTAGYASDTNIRDHALFLTRQSGAHLDLGNVEEAVALAHTAAALSGGVDSHRPSGAITELRGRLTAHQKVPAVAQFLEATA